MLDLLKNRDGRAGQNTKQIMVWECHANRGRVVIFCTVRITDPANLEMIFKFDLINAFDTRALIMLMHAGGFGVCSAANIRAGSMNFAMEKSLVDSITNMLIQVNAHLSKG